MSGAGWSHRCILPQQVSMTALTSSLRYYISLRVAQLTTEQRDYQSTVITTVPYSPAELRSVGPDYTHNTLVRKDRVLYPGHA